MDYNSKRPGASAFARVLGLIFLGAGALLSIASLVGPGGVDPAAAFLLLAGAFLFVRSALSM